CAFAFPGSGDLRDLHSFPTRRSSDLPVIRCRGTNGAAVRGGRSPEVSVELGKTWSSPNTSRKKVSGSGLAAMRIGLASGRWLPRSEEHTSELQSRENLVCRLLLEKKN